MNPLDPLEEVIFVAACALSDAKSREVLLDRACAGNDGLRRRIEELLAADVEATRFLGDDPLELAPARDGRQEAVHAPPEGPQDSRIGRYRLLEKIGEGGMGMVHLAEQEEPLRRRVALKIIKLGMDTRQVVARFEAERQALALMDHPNIACVFDGGATESGRPFFVMELVRGVPITEFCDLRRLTTRERLELFIPVCHAVQHAHQKGVIHRDLKPSNILVTERDGRAIPKVIDFGIAKAAGAELTNKTLFTGFHQLLGTPAYMSPEQAGLEGLDVDTRTDIYSLGVLLYEILTGHTPLDALELREAGSDAIFKTIREKDPPRPSKRLSALRREELSAIAARRGEDPRRLPRSLRGDLDRISLKTLEKDRTRRYESANDLARDLQRFLNHEPVTAVPPTVGYQLAKFARKHRMALGVAAALLGVLVVGTTVSLWQAIIAVAAQVEQRHALYASDMGLAFQGWELGRAGLTRELLENQRPKSGQEDLRGWEWRYLWAASRTMEQAIYPATNHYGYGSCALSRDGRWLAGGTGDGTVLLWNLLESRPVKYLGDTTGLVIADAVGFSADSRLLVQTRRSRRDVLVWEFGQDKLLLRLTNSLAVHQCALSPDGNWIAACGGYTYSGNQPGELRLWRLSDGKEVTPNPAQPVGLVNLRFSPDSSVLIAMGGKGYARLWSVPALNEVARLTHVSDVWDGDFSPDGQRLVTGDLQGFLHAWERDPNTGSWTRLWSQSAHVGSCDRVRWSPDGRAIATGGRDQIIRYWLWAPSGRLERSEFKGHSGRITGLAFSSDGRELFSSCQDKTIRRWNLAKANLSETLHRGGSDVGMTLAISPDSRWLVQPAPSNRLEIVELAGWKTVGAAEGRWPAFSPDGKWVATVILPNRVRFHETVGWQSIREFTLETPIGLPAVFAPDGSRLAIPTADGRVFLWDLASWTSGPPLTPGAGPLAGVFYGETEGELTVVHQGNGSLETFDMVTRRSLRQIPTGSEFVLNAARAVRGRAFALAETGPRVRVWLEEGNQTRRLNADAGSMVSVAWSPDGQTLAGGTFEGMIKLWNLRTLREVGTLRGHVSMVTALAFSPDGRYLVSGGLDGTRRWTASDESDR